MKFNSGFKGLTFFFSVSHATELKTIYYFV